MIEKAINKITSLQPKERTAVWMVGEQLKDFCRANPHDADLIFHDLDIPEMSLVHAEKKIKSFADKNKTGSFSCVTPLEAEDILRKFYGLTARKENQSNFQVNPIHPEPDTSEPPKAVALDLDDFL